MSSFVSEPRHISPFDVGEYIFLIFGAFFGEIYDRVNVDLVSLVSSKIIGPTYIEGGTMIKCLGLQGCHLCFVPSTATITKYCVLPVFLVLYNNQNKQTTSIFKRKGRTISGCERSSFFPPKRSGGCRLYRPSQRRFRR